MVLGALTGWRWALTGQDRALGWLAPGADRLGLSAG
jgi:hypothetical protein